MAAIWTKGIIALGALAGMLLVFSLGYFKGAEDWDVYNATYEAVATVTQLRELREGRYHEAIRLLETDLNAQIAKRATYEQGLRFTRYFSSPSDEEKLLRLVAKYRQEFPVSPRDEAAQELIEELLRRYR